MGIPFTPQANMFQITRFSASLVILFAGVVSLSSAQSDDKTYLSVNRSMGFRPAGFVTVQSDYRFSVATDRTWEYQAYDGAEGKEYKLSGELPLAMELLEQRLGEFGLNDIPEPDPNEPKIADAPALHVRRTVDGKAWHRELRPSSPEAAQLHRLVQFIVTGVRELSTDDYSLQDDEPLGIGQPIVIAGEEELNQVFEASEALTELGESIDFEKQQLLVFRWAGSGQDDLFAYLEDDESAKLVFAYRGGLTRDLRQHSRIYVVPRDQEWEQRKLPPPRVR